MRVRSTHLSIGLLIGLALPGPRELGADVLGCACDASRPATLEARECSLCQEAEKQSRDVDVFVLKDISPRKPNRWLALPRAHAEGPHSLHDMPAADRTKLFRAAIAKAKELWGEEWGIAYNSERVRTQCHTHVHIGKLLKGLSPGRFVDVSRVEDIPVPEDGAGLWIHPVGGKLRVHLGEEITETVLLR
jgi:diadenosine tetraphosphate (Ap4A) HIT family hydrolase